MADQKIQDFCSMAGVSAVIAEQLLQVCDGNLEQAINMVMEDPSLRNERPERPDATADEPKPSENLITWSQDYCDFALVVDSGEKLHCHKIYLAKSSEFFKTMLDSEFVEAKNNEMRVKEYDVETVASLLSYIYSDKNTAVGLYNLFRRLFDAQKLTPELLRLAHMYQVQDLIEDCTTHLAQNVNDTNVVTIWMSGETCQIERLKEAAFAYMVNSPNRDLVLNCRDMDKVFKSPERNKELVGVMIDEVIKVKTENAAHVAEKAQLTAALNAAQKQVDDLTKKLANEKTIAVNISMPEGGYVGDFRTLVKRTKTVGQLKDLFLISDEDDNEEYDNFYLTHNGTDLDDNRTFESYNIANNATLQVEWDPDHDGDDYHDDYY